MSNIERPVSPLLIALFGEIEREAQRRVVEAVQLGSADAALPPGTKIDLQRKVWILPPVAPE